MTIEHKIIATVILFALGMTVHNWLTKTDERVVMYHDVDFWFQGAFTTAIIFTWFL